MAEDEPGSIKEEDDFGVITPSKFYTKNLETKIIDYSNFDQNAWIKLEDASISDLPLLNNHNVLDLIEQFCKEFDMLPKEELFTNVTPLVADMGAYLCQCVIAKVAYQLAVLWPPAIPRIHPSIPSFIILLSKILHQSSDPTKFIYFIMTAFFSRMWTQKSCLINQYLVSICTCKYKNDTDCWALIDRDRMFKLYRAKKDGVEEKIKCQITKCYANTEKTKIIVLDINQRNVCEFEPLEKDQIQLWDLIYSRQKVPFPFYLTSFQESFPPTAYWAFYNCVTSNDDIIVTAIMKTDLYEPDIWESLVRIFCYAQKLQFLIETVYLNTFNDTFEMTNESFEKPNHFILFARGIGKVFFQEYYDNFFNKIAQLIDFHDDLELTDISLVDVKLCEKVFFNVLKYLMMSSYAIPIYWRQAMNILRTYLDTKYNSMSKTALGLSAFFGRGIIVSFFKENEDFLKESSICHPENFPVFGYLLSLPFCFNVYGGTTANFIGWNRRLECHFFPQYFKFLLNISDLKQEVPFYTPEEKSFSFAIDCIMRQLVNTDFAAQVKSVIVNYMDSNARGQTLSGWNLACLCSNLFQHSYDPIEKTKKKKKAVVKTDPVKLPALPIFQQIGKGANGGGRGMGGSGYPHISFEQNASVANDDKSIEGTGGGGMDPFKIGKNPTFYLPGKERSVNFGDSPTKMRLPDMPPSSKYNPIEYTAQDLNTVDDTRSDEALTLSPKRMQEPPSKNKKVPRDFQAVKPPGSLGRQPVPPSSAKKAPASKLPLPPIPSKPSPMLNKSKNMPQAKDSDEDDMKDFLKTMDSDDDKPKKPAVRGERMPPPPSSGVKKMKFVQVDASKVDGSSHPKLYKKVVK